MKLNTSPIRLSVVTVTYRDPVGLGATLRSLLPVATLGMSWEIVVVDSSPDLNDEILRDPALAPLPIVRVVRPAEGIYPAFNDGVAATRGELCWILNGGDRLRNVEALARVLDHLDTDPALALVLSGADLTRDGKLLYAVRPRGDFARQLIGSNRACHQAIVYRTSALRAGGRFATDLRIASDYEHHLKLLLSGARAACRPEVLVAYDMSGSSSQTASAFAEFKRVHRRLGPRMTTGQRMRHELVRAQEHARVSILKRAAASPVAGLLRPIWLAWKRRGRA